jgi:hypothetical protein
MFGRQTDQSATLLILTSGGMMSLWAATMYQGMTAIDTKRRHGTLDLLVAIPVLATHLIQTIFAAKY